ncbi:1521_t:CDS:2 [Funneliformis geosporum]|nr:1521_t:CDS:2 [Funneliformis geosporum]
MESLSPALDVLHQSSFQEKYKVHRPVSYLQQQTSIVNTKRQVFKIHVWKVGPMRENEDQHRGIQQIDDRFEINSDSDAGVKLEICPNRHKTQSSLGKLYRIGTLVGNAWSKENPKTPCRYIFANSCHTKEAHKASGSQVPMHEMSDLMNRIATIYSW